MFIFKICKSFLDDSNRLNPKCFQDLPRSQHLHRRKLLLTIRKLRDSLRSHTHQFNSQVHQNDFPPFHQRRSSDVLLY